MYIAWVDMCEHDKKLLKDICISRKDKTYIVRIRKLVTGNDE